MKNRKGRVLDSESSFLLETEGASKCNIKDCEEKEFDTFFNIVDIPMLFFDKNLRIRYLNRSAEKLFCLSDSQGERTLEKISVDFDKVGLSQDLKSAFNGAIVPEKKIIIEGGNYLRKIASTKTKKNDVDGIVVTFCERAKAKEGEEKLRKSEIHYQTLTSISPVGIFFTDLKLEDFYMNERCMKITGLTPEEAKKKDWIKAVHPEDRAQVLSQWKKSLRGHEAVKWECRFLHADGRVSWSLCQLTVELDDRGEVKLLVGSVTDITKLHEAEEILRQQQVELVNIGRLSAIKEIASGIAHELNQPLTSIVQYIGGCLRRLRKENVSAEIISIMEKAMKQAERTGEIIHHLKNFLRKGKLQKEWLDINKTIYDLFKLLDVKHTYKNVNIQLQFAKNLPQIKADKLHLEQVMINIIQNALEAMQAEMDKEQLLTVQTLFCDDQHLIKVIIIDSGPGILEKFKDKIFNPFFTTKSGGMGIGLSLSQSIVEAHSGSLYVNPKSKKGAEFHLTLPVCEQTNE